MKRAYVAWYVLAALLVVGPAGTRMYFWPRTQAQAVDPAMADAGKMLFNHEWQVNDPLSPGGDGLGPVFNAKSCVACHNQGGVGGAGDNKHNVTTFIAADQRGKVRSGVIHSDAISPTFQEHLGHAHPQLPAVSRPSLESILVRTDVHGNVVEEKPNGPQVVRINIPPGVHISQRNTPALFGAKLIDEVPDRVILAQERSQNLRYGMASWKQETVPVGRAFLLADGRVGKFGWKAQSAGLIDFVEAACANELGLGNPGQAQPVSLNRPEAARLGLDLTTEQCQQIAAFIAALPQPQQKVPGNERDLARMDHGKQLFHQIGCANCHVPNVGSIEGVYSDLLLHRMGRELESVGGGYNSPPPAPESPGNDSEPLPDEWRTPPLWGIADSAPYMHDGRAKTLQEAIEMHAGQGKNSAERFRALDPQRQHDLTAFLSSLKAPH